jgi:hypothetical protein
MKSSRHDKLSNPRFCFCFKDFYNFLEQEIENENVQ